MEKLSKPQSLLGTKRKRRKSVSNSASETILAKVESPSEKGNVSKKMLNITDVPIPPSDFVPNKKTKTTAISMEEMAEKYPILKNEALINRIMQIKMNNNNKGRIRTAIKSQLVGSDNKVSADIINGKINGYLKNPELTPSDLRRLRVLYNMLKTTLQSIASGKDKESESENKVETAGASKKKKKQNISETEALESENVNANKDNVEVPKKKKKKAFDTDSADNTETLDAVKPKKKAKKHKLSVTENVETQEAEMPKKKNKIAETENAEPELENEKNENQVKNSKKRNKKDKKHKQESGDGENETQKGQTKVKGPKRYVVFVGSLPVDITQEKLMSHFSEIENQICNIRIPKVKEGKQAIAFIELTSEPAYEMALSKNHTILAEFNRRINVNYTTQPNSKVSSSEAKGKAAKLAALQKSGKLAGSAPAHNNRTRRRNVAKRARAEQEAHLNA